MISFTTIDHEWGEAAWTARDLAERAVRGELREEQERIARIRDELAAHGARLD